MRVGAGLGGIAQAPALAWPHVPRRAPRRLALAGDLLVGEPADATRPPRPGRLARCGKRPGPVSDPAGSEPPEAPAARSRLHRLLQAGEFVVTAELPATDSAEPHSIQHLGDALRGRVDAVNCTDNSAAHAHLGPLAAAHLLLDRGVEPILQLACRDRNRLAP